MVTGRSASSFAVLLRISRYPCKTAPRPVTTCAPAFNATQNHHSPVVPLDDGDHDLDIDLVTLRRRPAPKLDSKPTLKDAQEAEQEIKSRPPPEHSLDRPDESIINAPPLSAEHAASTSSSKLPFEKNSPQPQRGLTKGDTRVVAGSQSECGVAAPKDVKRRRQSSEGKSRSSDASFNNLDPFIVPYLKSLQHKSSKATKPPVSVDSHPSPQDLDVEFLRPNDIRATYVARRKRMNTGKNEGEVNNGKTTSGEPGIIAEHLIHAGIQHLNLALSDGKVVIPRRALVRLIEQTINLSGAAVHGDDVVIERYSPTWHRFARLLRTSDLHKISSSSNNPNSLLSSAQQNIDHEQPEAQGVTDLQTKRTATTPTQSASQSKQESLPIATAVAEREYVILTLDARKKRVVTTRFRRLLDGSSNVPLPSSENLLKVEHLNKYAALLFDLELTHSCRYLSYLKPLEIEGFYVTAASDSGIVLSRNLNADNVSGDVSTGWLQRLLGTSSVNK